MAASTADIRRKGSPTTRARASPPGQAWAPIVFLAPAVLLCGTFVHAAILETMRLSLHQWDGAGPKTWLGLGNYAELLSDPVFYKALLNNIRWTAIFVVAAPALGLALALLASQAFPGIRLIRALFFLPFVISQVVVGLVFAWFFHTEFGLFNRLLGAIGLPGVAPLESETWAIYAVIGAALWPQLAYCMILYLNGLAVLRRELIDAARLDGATNWQLLRHVILPQLRPVTFIVVMVCAVSALRSFDFVMVMTLGGPYDSSNVLAFYMFEQTFTGFRYGYGAAIATVLFLLMWTCIGAALWRMLRGERR